MSKFFEILNGLILSLLLVLVVCGLAHSMLPGDISASTVEIDPNASMAAKALVHVVLPMADKKVEDHIIFKTAELRLGDQTLKLVALPGTKWFRYQ